MDFIFDNNYIFLAGIVALVAILYFASKEPSFNPQPVERPPQIKADMTLEELKPYNGEEKPNVLVAVKGIIYDVSSSDFYKKGAAYSVFAGHDASINLAQMSHSEDLLNKWGSYTLDDDQTGILNDWELTFREKYPVVGMVIV